MSYGNFVGQLNKGIEGYIIAYDNKEEHGGCILYLRKRPCTIFISAPIIDQHRSEVIRLLREKIITTDWNDHHLTVVNDEGILTFESNRNTNGTNPCSPNEHVLASLKDTAADTETRLPRYTEAPESA